MDVNVVWIGRILTVLPQSVYDVFSQDGETFVCNEEVEESTCSWLDTDLFTILSEEV